MHKHQLSLVASSLLIVSVVTSCSRNTSPKPVENVPVSAARSALRTIDTVISGVPASNVVRKAALVGVYVAQFVSALPISEFTAVMQGLATHLVIFENQNGESGPDYQLLQAFADALDVKIPDLLNRSANRQKSLDTYIVALNAVAEKANTRFTEIEQTLAELKDTQRQQQNAVNTLERDIKRALNDKDFSTVSTKQKELDEKQKLLTDSSLKVQQTEGIHTTLDTMLTIYGERILAVQQNREVLISGLKVVDVPGVEDLDVIMRSRGNSRARRSEVLNGFFDFSSGLNAISGNRSAESSQSSVRSATGTLLSGTGARVSSRRSSSSATSRNGNGLFDGVLDGISSSSSNNR